ncbi:hypothetical protein ACIG87_20330 [Micromonospora sp. NPDC051925]|uniref:hypothetical protein n=1 Tax=Micromonospora sp. NPDC051925 TaxID=3364288 RepID=UPI0037CAF425
MRDLLGRGAAVVSRTGRHQQAVERREPVAPESCHACGAPSRRRHAPHGRPLTADVAPGPLRVSVLRC